MQAESISRVAMVFVLCALIPCSSGDSRARLSGGDERAGERDNVPVTVPAAGTLAQTPGNEN